MGIVHAELVVEVGPHGRVVAVDLAERVGVARGAELIALHVIVVELGDIRVDDEVRVEVNRFVDVGEELGREEAVVRLGAEMPVVGEFDVSEGGVDVKKADAGVGALGLAREGDHAGRGKIPCEHDDVVSTVLIGVVHDGLNGDREVRHEILAAGEYDYDVVQRQVKACGRRGQHCSG